MEESQISRLDFLRKKFENEGPSSLSQVEGEEFVKLMRAEAQSFSRTKATKRAGVKKEPKSAPAPTAAAFAAKLAALKATK